MVDGQGKTWYNTACDFPSEAHALVWLSWSFIFCRTCAVVASMAEQLTRNEQVAGSNPATSSKSDRILLNTVTFITFQRICNE